MAEKVTRPENSPHAAESIRILEKMLPQADSYRADSLESLGRIRAVKGAVLEREQARLTEKYGAKDPSVQAISQQIETNQVMTRFLSSEAVRAGTTPVNADPNAWILHGRVFDQQSNPQPNLTISLYDANNRWIESLGYDCTDSTGYFKLTHAMKGSVIGSHDVAPRATATGGAAAAPAGPYFIHVLDAKSSTLAVDSRELTPAADRVDYVEIVIGGAAPSDCPSPSGKERKPPRPTKSKK
jgi:hypothetical protein